MSLSKDQFDKLARLSRLSVSAEDHDRILPAIDAMVTWADTLRQAPTQGLEPMANPHDMVLRLREDLAQPLPSRETLMRNAPQMAEGFFIVPRVVE